MKKIKYVVKGLQGFTQCGEVSYNDLCLFSDLIVPKKFKLLEFERYDGDGNPYVHLRLYLGKMSQYKHNEKANLCRPSKKA